MGERSKPMQRPPKQGRGAGFPAFFEASEDPASPSPGGDHQTRQAPQAPGKAEGRAARAKRAPDLHRISYAQRAQPVTIRSIPGILYISFYLYL